MFAKLLKFVISDEIGLLMEPAPHDEKNHSPLGEKKTSSDCLPVPLLPPRSNQLIGFAQEIDRILSPLSLRKLIPPLVVEQKKPRG